MSTIRLTHIDGKLPNLALMKLAHWHRSQGDEVILRRSPEVDLWEPAYDRVYGSAIFQWSGPAIRRLKVVFPEAIVGGTGSDSLETIEQSLGLEASEYYDYSIYPEYPFSIGFTQRGCRLNCGFCVVPQKEGRPVEVNTIQGIWREGTPRCVVLLDNDFFGQPEETWRERIHELRTGGFKVNFCQGINVRMITSESSQAIASIPYYDTKFKYRRLYTAWDNLGQEKVFFKGFELLKEAGVKPSHIMVYMLIGYKPGETLEEIMYRYRLLKEAGCLPYPMVYDQSNKVLKRFQRWVIRRHDEVVPWKAYIK